VATSRSSSNNTSKMNLQTILNKRLPQPHIELKLKGFGVTQRLMKNEVHPYTYKNLDPKI
jgi:hypothetical protein